MKRRPSDKTLSPSKRELVHIGVEDVVVRRRIRKNLGDLTLLMDSMRTHGLLNPIVITTERELVAGHRRLESARRLGWQRITASVIEERSETALLEVEIDENTHRKDLNTDELADAYVRLDRLKNPGPLKKLWRSLIAFFQRLFGGR